MASCFTVFFFFFNDTATTEIYTLSLHDALPIYRRQRCRAPHAHRAAAGPRRGCARRGDARPDLRDRRSEEHTSELQSLAYLVCRLLLEKKKILVARSRRRRPRVLSRRRGRPRNR